LKIENVLIIPEIEDKLIWKHSVFRYEVEESFENKPLFRFERKGNLADEHVYSAMSVTDSGRFLAIFFIYKQTKDALIITARNITKKERQYYAKRRK